MGKITITIKSKSTPTEDLEQVARSILESPDAQFYIPDDANIEIKPEE